LYRRAVRALLLVLLLTSPAHAGVFGDIDERSPGCPSQPDASCTVRVLGPT
jgi:hypothetical protein